MVRIQVQKPTSRSRTAGFTLIELLVVLAIVAMLLTLAVPRYFQGVAASKEAVLRENLRLTRDALDKFKADIGRYPDSLNDLVERQYLRSVPLDPLTEQSSTWEFSAPGDAAKGRIADLHSGADGIGRNGVPYRQW